MALDNLNEVVKSHMEDCVYSMECEECGTHLEFESSVDRDMDLYITVSPCPVCIQAAVLEAIEEKEV